MLVYFPSFVLRSTLLQIVISPTSHSDDMLLFLPFITSNLGALLTFTLLSYHLLPTLSPNLLF
jgi:hypothetical protein